MACVCHSLAACQRHAPLSLVAVIGLSNNGVISLLSLRSLCCVRCVGWKPRLSKTYRRGQLDIQLSFARGRQLLLSARLRR